MHKKAGIVIGVILVTLAVVIHFVFGVGKDEKPKSTPKPTQTTQETNPPKIETTQPPAQDQPIQPQPQQPQSQPEQTQPTKVFSEFTEAEFQKALGEASFSNKEIMTVSSKKVVLMDSDATIGSRTGKQLVFAVSLSGDNSDLKLTAYLNKEAYDTINVGDKLTVDYEVYENVNGVRFPVIRSIQK